MTETLRGVFSVDANQGWAVGASGTIVHTVDGGAHWTKQAVATTDEFRGIAFTDAKTGWATSIRSVHHDAFGGEDDWQATIWHTCDGGRTWSEQDTPELPMVLTAVNFVDANTGWALGFVTSSAVRGGAIFSTADGGKTWSRQQPGSACEHNLWDVQFVDRSRGYAVGAMYGAAWGPPVCRTSDGGATWTDVKMGEHDGEGLYGVAVVGD